jgi:molybdate transport repressor ModE-like protein
VGWAAPIRAPDIAELETLVACATDGSMAEAARRLGISRPAVAKRIANLETLAGRPLLQRRRSGVTLTADGAAVLAGARRILEERDVLVGVLTEVRSGLPSALQGLRPLLGDSAVSARSSQLAETRLADAERLLELVLRSTSSAVSLTDVETGGIYEVNDAMCRLLGRTRDELVGQHAIEREEWYTSSERAGLIDTIRRDGAARDFVTRVVRPDASTRIASSTVYLISLAGQRLLLWIIEDVTSKYGEDFEPSGGNFPVASSDGAGAVARE